MIIIDRCIVRVFYKDKYAIFTRHQNITIPLHSTLKYILMHRLITVIGCILIMPFMLNGQNPVTRELEPFNKLRVTSEIDAQLVLSEEPSLEIDFTGVDPALLEAEVVDQTLSLRIKTGKYERGSLKVRIFFTDLVKIESSGRASIWSNEELFSPEMELNLDNGGSIRLNLVTDHLTSELIQGSILMLKGRAKQLDLEVSTAATFSAFEFQVEEADVLANSTGKAKVSVSRYLKAKAVSGGYISYLGKPEKLDAKASLKGEIVQGFLDE